MTSMIQTLGLDEIKEFEEQIRAHKQALVDQENARYANLLRETVETALTERDLKTADSGRIGVDVSGIPITIDGHTYRVSLSITHTTAARAKAKAAEKATA